MNFSYPFSFSSDFNESLALDQLHDQITMETAIAPNCLGVNQSDDEVTIEFDAALSPGEETALNNVIAAHTPVIRNKYKVWCISDEKISGSGGGDAAANTWQTRTLNTVGGSNNPEVLLANNQITFQVGTYQIFAQIPAYRVGNHQARLYNITDDETASTGSTEFSHILQETSSQTSSTVKTVITVAGNAKIFEVQHYCSQAHESEGLGRSSGILNEKEVYSLVEIIKLKT